MRATDGKVVKEGQKQMEDIATPLPSFLHFYFIFCSPDFPSLSAPYKIYKKTLISYADTLCSRVVEIEAAHFTVRRSLGSTMKTSERKEFTIVFQNKPSSRRPRGNESTGEISKVVRSTPPYPPRVSSFAWCYFWGISE